MCEDKGNPETLADNGERRVISMLRSVAKARDVDSPGIYPDDDACVLSFGEELLAISTDTIWGKTHIPGSANAEDAGWYLAAINLSDLAAMGAKPIGLFLTINAPANTPARWLEELMLGFSECLKHYGAKLLGGDTKEGPGVYSATAIGRCSEGMVTPRSGAKPGDLVAVTGTLGHYPMLLVNGDGKGALRIAPRVDEGLAGARIGVNAAIDLSDGLGLSLHYLAEASGVRIEIDPDNIPIDDMVDGDDTEELVWFFGGDFELLLTFPPDKEDEIADVYEKLGTPLTIMGRVVDGEGVFSSMGNSFIPVDRKGYEHFSKRGE